MNMEFLKATAIRALRTFCQALLATIGTAVVIADIDWLTALSTATVAALLSVLTSIVTGLPEAGNITD